MHIGWGPMKSLGPIWVEVLQPARAAGTWGPRALLIRRPAASVAATRAPTRRIGIHGRLRQDSGRLVSSSSTTTGRRGAAFAFVTYGARTRRSPGRGHAWWIRARRSRPAGPAVA